MILSIVRGDFKSFLGKKTNTRETWKTYFKPNILEGKSKRFVLRKKKKTKKKQKRERKKKHTMEKKKRKKEVEREVYVSFQWFSKRKKCYSTRLNSSNIPRQMLSESCITQSVFSTKYSVFRLCGPHSPPLFHWNNRYQKLIEGNYGYISSFRFLQKLIVKFKLLKKWKTTRCFVVSIIF